MKKERAALLQMLLCTLLWSTSGLLVKLVPWNALVIAGCRSILTGIVMGLYMRARRMRLVRSRQSFAIAVALMATYITYLPAIKLTTAANAIVLEYTAPIYVLVFSAIFRRQPMRRGDVLAVLLTIAGVALCFVDQIGGGSLMGNLLGLASGVFFGAMFTLSGGADEETRMSGMLLSQIMMGLLCAPLAFAYDTPVTATNILFIVLLGVVQLGIPNILYSLSVRYVSPLTCSLIASIQPLINPIWVYLAVGERPGKYAFIGGAVVLVTITLWYAWDARSRHRIEIAAQAESPAS
ncbi:MAG: DMT family transporter [Bacillota bacterium]